MASKCPECGREVIWATLEDGTTRVAVEPRPEHRYIFLAPFPMRLARWVETYQWHDCKKKD